MDSQSQIKSPKRDIQTKIIDAKAEMFEETQKYQNEIQIMFQESKKIVFKLYRALQQSILSQAEKEEVGEYWSEFVSVFSIEDYSCIIFEKWVKEFFEKWNVFSENAINLIDGSRSDNQLLSFYSQQIAVAKKYMKILSKKCGKPAPSLASVKSGKSSVKLGPEVFEEADRLFADCLTAIEDSNKDLRIMEQPLNSVNKIVTTKVKKVLGIGATAVDPLTAQQYKYTADILSKVIDSYNKLMQERADHIVLRDLFIPVFNNLSDLISSTRNTLANARIAFKRRKEEKVITLRQKEEQRKTPKKQLPKYDKMEIDTSRSLLKEDDKKLQITLKPPKRKNNDEPMADRRSAAMSVKSKSKDEIEVQEGPADDIEEKEEVVQDDNGQENSPLIQNVEN